MSAVDSRGVRRGFCNVPGCSCSCYAISCEGMKCDKCGHPPVKHAKQSMTAPVQSVSEAEESSSNSGSDSEDEAPVAVMSGILNSSLGFFPFFGAKGQNEHPSRDALSCRFPNCANAAFFDLNTREESMFCSEHISAGPAVAMYTEPSPSALQVQSALWNQTVSQRSHTQLQHTAFPQTAFHPSQSAPNLSLHHQTSHTRSLPAAVLRTQPPPAQTPMLAGMKCKTPSCSRSRRAHEDGNGHYDYCGRSCRDRGNTASQQATVLVGMKCKTPSCSRPRRAREDGNGYYDYCGRSCRDGSSRTVESAPNELCSFPGCNKPKYWDPANGRVHDYCGRTHANQARAKGIAPQVCSLRQLGSSELAQVQAHFQKEWASLKGACPPITCVFQVTNHQLEQRWKVYQQRLPASLQTPEKYFHGTRLTCDIVNTGTTCNDKNCGICGISKFGMYRECIRKNINFQRFGHGFYFAPNSSKCHDYTQGVQTHRAMLLVDILPGKKHTILTNDQELMGPPDGCHSVFGKPGQTLNYAELVVYNPDCVMPRYITVYVLNGVHKIAS